MFDTLGALAVVVLPRRHWDRFDGWPLHHVAPASGILTVVAGGKLLVDALMVIGYKGVTIYSF